MDVSRHTLNPIETLYKQHGYLNKNNSRHTGNFFPFSRHTVNFLDVSRHTLNPIETLVKVLVLIVSTCAFKDDGLIIHPAVAWEIIGFTFDVDRHSVDEPITVKPLPIILQCHHQRLADIFSGHFVLISLSGFEVVVKPLV